MLYAKPCPQRKQKMADRPNRVGQQLGNYRLIRLLGEGGFAEVYLAEHIYLKTQVAAKVLQEKMEAQSVESFLKEAQMIAALKHPHILRVLDFGMEGATPFLVMEYALGGTLRQKHPRGSKVPLPTVISYARQVAMALQYAHDQKIVHRDVKPENVLVEADGKIVLGDFGIAIPAHKTQSLSTQEAVGTVSYMAPEQIQGKPRAASDQYSLGIVVYEWLCGDRPFHGSFTEVCTQQMFAPPPPLREKMPTISPDLEQVVMTALAKDPKQRFASVQAFATALEQTSVLGPNPSDGSPRDATPSSQLSSSTVLAIPPNQSLQSINQQYNPPAQQPYPPSPAYPTYTLPASTRKQGDKGMRNVLPIGFAVLIILVAIALFFVVHKNQSAADKATATATASTFQNPYLPHTGRLALNDPLSNNSKHYNWSELNNSSESCAFTGEAYHAKTLEGGYYYPCFAQNTDFMDFSYEVQMKIVRGDCGAILFRSDSASGKFYYFRVCQGGSYALYLYVNNTGTNTEILINPKTNPAVHAGLNQTNLVAIVARTHRLDLYMNHQKIDSISDSTYSHGQIGVVADGFPASEPTEVVYSNAKVWGHYDGKIVRDIEPSRGNGTVQLWDAC
jgi:serine/threonine protein kinase